MRLAAVLSSAVLIVSCHAGVSFAAPFVASELTGFAAMEAAVMTAADLVHAFGAAPGALDVAATFDDTSWTLSISGTYGGTALDLSFTGEFDPLAGAGSHTLAGTFGTEEWTGSGMWSFSDVDPATTALAWDSEAEIGPIAGPKKRIDKHIVEKTYSKDADGTVRDRGTYCRTVNDVPDPPDCPPNGVRRQTSSIERLPGRTVQSVVLQLPDDGARLFGEYDPDRGTFTGRLSVPEPSVSHMLGVAAALLGLRLLGLPRRHRRR
jgi:hypothetical protein